MIEGVTIEQLRTLRAVVETGSFSAAARKLGRVQAAVSQSIERLEAQLELKLFDRTSRLPVLTRHGEAIVAAAARIHDDVDALDELAASLRRGVETKLSIAVDSMFPTAALVTFAREFASKHPAVQLALSTEALSAVTTLVREKRAMLGIAGEDADLSQLVRRRIAEILLIPVAAPTHALSDIRGAIDAESLSRHVQIVLSERYPSTDRQSPDHGVLSPRTWRVADLATKHALIVAGLGWGHMPEPFVREDIDAQRLTQLTLEPHGDEPPHRTLFLVHRRGAALGPIAQWVQTRMAELCLQAVGTTAHHQSA